MKRIPSLAPVLLLALVFALPAGARAPRKPPLMTYKRLWTNSPFTTKPIAETGPVVEDINPFEDWALGGVSSFNGRYLVTLFNRKDASQQKLVDQSDKHSDFRVVSVNQDPDDYTKTVVVLSSGGKTGTVTYDEKLLATRGAVAAKTRQARAQAAARARSQKHGKMPPGVRPPGGSARPPRMRVVPPTNSKKPTPSSSRRGGSGRHGSGRHR
jgi:hypothetical protein